MPVRAEPGKIIQAYFRSKAKQLLAASDQALSDHAGLRGSHREAVIRLYLQDVLPGRFTIGRGMVYGPRSRSKEADIVIWDSMNYPRLEMNDHTLFFADAVRAVLEVKTRYSKEDLNDIVDKCRAVRDIVPEDTQPNLETILTSMGLEMRALRENRPFPGFMTAPFHIGTGAIILHDGSTFSTKSIDAKTAEEIDDAWPDVLVLLEAGKVVVKEYAVDGHGFAAGGKLSVVTAGEDALLLFTDELLRRLVERSVYVESPLSLEKYVNQHLDFKTESLPFAMTRPHRR